MSELENIGKQNISKRNKRTLIIYFLSFLTGIAFVTLIKARERNIIETDFPILVAMVLLILFIGYLNWVWYTGMDEFEKGILGYASVWGISVGALIVPWIVLHELSIVPEPDALFLLAFIYAVTLIIYYYKKFSNR